MINSTSLLPTPQSQHLLIAIKDMGNGAKECHFIEISPIWESLLKDPVKLTMMTEEVYHKITDPNYTEIPLTEAQLQADYGDSEASQVRFIYIYSSQGE